MPTSENPKEKSLKTWFWPTSLSPTDKRIKNVGVAYAPSHRICVVLSCRSYQWTGRVFLCCDGSNPTSCQTWCNALTSTASHPVSTRSDRYLRTLSFSQLQTRLRIPTNERLSHRVTHRNNKWLCRKPFGSRNNNHTKMLKEQNLWIQLWPFWLNRFDRLKGKNNGPFLRNSKHNWVRQNQRNTEGTDNWHPTCMF